MPRYVVFDLGGVLVDWNPRYLYRKLLPPAEMETFLAQVATPDWNHELDAGRPFGEAIEERAARFPEHADLLRAYRDRWPEMLGDAIEGTVSLLEHLDARGVPLFALSNWSAETFHHAESRFPFLQRFRDIVLSGREKVAKPDPRIFEALFHRNELIPTEGCFVDDVPVNVEAARRLGMDGIRFEGPARLRADLSRRRLL